MRIGILNWRDAAHKEAGGAEAFVHEVGRTWGSWGHEVTLCSSVEPGLSRVDRDGDLRIIRRGHLRRGTHHLLGPRALSRTNPQVMLESINTIPYLLPLRPGLPPFLPLVHQLALDVWRAEFPRSLSWIAERAEPLLYRPYRNTEMTCVSNSTRNDLQSVGARHLSVIPQGGTGSTIRLEKEPSPTFIFVGRLAENKRPIDAVRAFRRIQAVHKTARLWIVGVGELETTIRRDLPSGAVLLGRLDRTELLKRMSRSHALLVTSVREGWGLVVTEANSVGTPAVAYDVPGLRDSVKHEETGLLTAPDPVALSNAAMRLIQHEDLRNSLIENAIEWGRSHSWIITAQVLLQRLTQTARIRQKAVPLTE